jgi:hypothetical protein
MTRIVAWTLMGVIAAAPLAGCESIVAGPGPAGPPSASCAPVNDEIDYARLQPEPRLLAEAIERAETAHVEVRRKAGVPAESTRGDHIRIFVWGSFLPGRYSIIANRTANGGWTVEKVSEGRDSAGGRLPPEAPSVVRVTLSADRAAELNALLADRCLYAEPTNYGRSVPMKEGGEAMCADGADELIEIEAGGRTHRSFHACQTHGRPGQVASRMWEALAPDS